MTKIFKAAGLIIKFILELVGFFYLIHFIVEVSLQKSNALKEQVNYLFHSKSALYLWVALLLIILAFIIASIIPKKNEESEHSDGQTLMSNIKEFLKFLLFAFRRLLFAFGLCVFVLWVFECFYLDRLLFPWDMFVIINRLNSNYNWL